MGEREREIAFVVGKRVHGFGIFLGSYYGEINFPEKQEREKQKKMKILFV